MTVQSKRRPKKDFFQAFYKERVFIIGLEYQEEFESWLDNHQTSIGYLINHGIAKRELS